MDAGIPHSIHRQHQLAISGHDSDSDEIPLFTLDPDGGLQVSQNDGGSAQPAAPYVITGDSPPSTFGPALPVTTAIPITQVSPSIATPPPSILSQDLLSQTAGADTSNIASSTDSPAAVVFTGSSSSPPTQPTSSTVTVTVYPSSESTRTLVSEASTLLSSSRTVSATSSSSYISSTMLSSQSSSMTMISISTSSTQTIVVSSFSSVITSSSSSVFTFSSSSSINSSAIATSTSSDQTPTETVTAPPLPGTGSNLNVHSPPYYVGIVLGTIAGIALLAALIAWWFRLKSHARRKRWAKTFVPWGRAGNDDDGGLEAGKSKDGYYSGPYGLNFASREDMAHLQAWTPRGDRDVGEPKRSESYLNGSTWSLHDHSIPGHNLFSAESFGAISSIDGYTPAGVRHKYSQRHLPAYLGGQGPGTRGLRDDASTYSNDHRRPLTVVNNVPSSLKPAYVSSGEYKPPVTGLEEDGRPDVPHRSMMERLRNRGRPPTEAPWEELGPLPTPGGSPQVVTNEAWASSIRSGLANAFNAVAANLSAAASAPRMTKNDKSNLASRTTRKSVRDTVWDEKTPSKDGLFRGDSLSTVTSKAWTLEDTGDGAGIVHFRMKDGDLVSKISQRPTMPTPNLSFGDGDSISMYSERDSDFHRVPTQESQIPLIASSRPLAAHVRTDGYLSRRDSSETISGRYVSRNSTTRSAAPTRSRRRMDHASNVPRVPPGINVHRANDEEHDSVVIQPDETSRSSSSNTSLLRSTIDGHSEHMERAELDAASQALRERQRKVSQGAVS
ncbi:hypothetical protein CVT25_007835 [Psilocybe cyanescens]|uniref:Uncharacterized protein n=1 Tax=Psilocybe cyanescens TaxID=93625 RepID=A0A409VQ92_PSICY|nr:hypothetical protein CVT25_007835 [Psilocybe cyanescens]